MEAAVSCPPIEVPSSADSVWLGLVGSWLDSARVSSDDAMPIDCDAEYSRGSVGCCQLLVIRRSRAAIHASRVCASEAYQLMHGFTAEQMQNATHLVWATGGGMVPEAEMAQYLTKGR